MSALAMILMAAMAIPGGGPEQVSWAMEQGLDLSGEWVGTIRHSFGRDYSVVLDKDGFLTEDHGAFTGSCFFDVSDGGKGKVQIRMGGLARTGINKREDEHVVICFCRDDRPTEFQAGNGRSLLTLHRVKHCK
jgi:hypothetical protein